MVSRGPRTPLCGAYAYWVFMGRVIARLALQGQAGGGGLMSDCQYRGWNRARMGDELTRMHHPVELSSIATCRTQTERRSRAHGRAASVVDQAYEDDR